MVTNTHSDADGEVLARLRHCRGPTFPIVLSLDLHGNLSPRLIELSHAAVAYRTYPHVDQRECGRRAASLLVRLLRGQVQPRMALAKPPVIINIMAQDTNSEPMKGFMNAVRDLERQRGISSASLLPGFAYADVPQMGPSVLIVTDGNADLGRRE